MRFSRTRFSSHRLRRIAAWAMLPLAVLNGRPILGCVCADGQYKTDCPAMTETAKQTDNDSCRGESCRGADCCGEATPTEPSHSCCDRTASTDNADQSSQDTTGERLADGNGCCHVVVRAPVPPPLVDIVQVTDDHHLLALSALVSESFGEHDAASFGGRVDDDTGQPPSDLVITLRRLLI